MALSGYFWSIAAVIRQTGRSFAAGEFISIVAKIIPEESRAYRNEQTPMNNI
jgi:hypothetical protein